MRNILLCFLFILPINVFATNHSDKVSAEPLGVKWLRTPKPSFQNEDLKGYDRSAVVHFETDDKGTVTQAKIIKSTGIGSLDQKVIEAVMKSKLRPYTNNGISYPTNAEQKFEFSVLRTPKFENYPHIKVNINDIKGETRYITIYSEADDHGRITIAEIKKSSGLPELDQKVLSEFRKQAKFYPLIINGSPYPIREETQYVFSDKVNTFD